MKIQDRNPLRNIVSAAANFARARESDELPELDKAIAELARLGMSGIVIIDNPDAEYQQRIVRFLKSIGPGFDFQMKRPWLAVGDDDLARRLYRKAIAAGIKAELILSER